MSRILPIVEGDGDLLAVPELIRRVAHAQGRCEVDVLRPHKRGDLPKVESRFEDFVKVALLENCPVLWVLDYDCADCNDVERQRLAAQVDLDRLRQRSPSFGRFEAAVLRLL